MTFTYPMCSTCGHNVSAVVGGEEHGRCTAFVLGATGMPEFCNCPCPEDPVVQAWLRGGKT